jgi:poly(A) polymerase
MAELISALGGGEITRFVGGAVRDTLLDLPVSDVDLATRLEPGEVVERLRAAGIKAVPTGIAHGTVTAVSAGKPVEVTTLRRDVSTDGRRATVAFTDSWREDAARRDFTINALYAEPETGAVHDYFGGREDLFARRVRFIGDRSPGLPKTISASCVSSASTHASGAANPIRTGSTRARRAPTT